MYCFRGEKLRLACVIARKKDRSARYTRNVSFLFSENEKTLVAIYVYPLTISH